MRYKSGDVLLIHFPFTNFSKAKKRPVLVVKDENDLGDFICFQITSQKKQSDILPILFSDYREKELKIISFVKYDKCFTLNTEIVDKKLTSLNDVILKILKNFL